MTFDDDEDSYETPCAFCGRNTYLAPSGIFVELSEADPAAELDEAFCSWDHFAEWVVQGKPEPEKWTRFDYDFGTLDEWRWRVQWRIEETYGYLRAGLAAYGLCMLLRRWAATHPDEVARLNQRFPRLTRRL